VERYNIGDVLETIRTEDMYSTSSACGEDGFSIGEKIFGAVLRVANNIK
jgi:hypothetical protein